MKDKMTVRLLDLANWPLETKLQIRSQMVTVFVIKPITLKHSNQFLFFFLLVSFDPKVVAVFNGFGFAVTVNEF